MHIDDLRKEINDLDEKIAELFEKRMKVAEGIARYKSDNNLPILDKKREELLLEKNLKYIKNSQLEKYYKDFLVSFMDISKDYQNSILNGDKVIGYQGIPGSFSHIALKKKFENAKSKPYEDFEDVYSELREGKINLGVLPFENSSTGEIVDNYDLVRKYDCYIVGIVEVKVEHNLLGVKGTKVEDIKEVYSHPQGFKQSDKFLQGRNWKLIPYYNTAISSRYVKEQNDFTKGAIASIEAAKEYDLEVLARHINSRDNNYTRFAIVSKELLVEKEDNRVDIVFTTHHDPGSLTNVLNLLAEEGINMHSIKSRPIKDVPWEYFFHVELEGNAGDEELLKSIERIKIKTKFFRIIGSYYKGQ